MAQNLSRDEAVAAPICLSLPADEALIQVARLTASGVAAHVGLDFEALEDLKLAISEACADRIESGAAQATLSIRFLPEPTRLVVEVEGDGPAAGGTASEGDEAGYAIALMEAMVDSVERFLGRSGNEVLRLTKEIAAPAPSGSSSPGDAD